MKHLNKRKKNKLNKYFDSTGEGTRNRPLFTLIILKKYLKILPKHGISPVLIFIS